jgi:hypothetical protein
MTKAAFEKLLAKYGAVLDTESLDNDMLQIDAPKGKIFAGNGCHTIVVQYRNRGGQSWIADARADVAGTLAYGLYDCDETDCEICEEK